jgi:hypothetical protein
MLTLNSLPINTPAKNSSSFSHSNCLILICRLFHSWSDIRFFNILALLFFGGVYWGRSSVILIWQVADRVVFLFTDTSQMHSLKEGMGMLFLLPPPHPPFEVCATQSHNLLLVWLFKSNSNCITIKALWSMHTNVQWKTI